MHTRVRIVILFSLLLFLNGCSNKQQEEYLCLPTYDLSAQDFVHDKDNASAHSLNFFLEEILPRAEKKKLLTPVLCLSNSIHPYFNNVQYGVFFTGSERGIRSALISNLENRLILLQRQDEQIFIELNKHNKAAFSEEVEERNLQALFHYLMQTNNTLS